MGLYHCYARRFVYVFRWFAILFGIIICMQNSKTTNKHFYKRQNYYKWLNQAFIQWLLALRIFSLSLSIFIPIEKYFIEKCQRKS